MGALLGCWAPQGPRSPSRPWAAAGAGAGAPSREEAKALARPAGAAEDTGAAAALDGRSACRGQASQRSWRAGGAKPAQHRRREQGQPIRSRANPNSAAPQKKNAAPAIHGAAHQDLRAASICRRHHCLQLLDHTWLDEDTRLLSRDRDVEHPDERIPLEMRQPPGTVGLLRFHQART